MKETNLTRQRSADIQRGLTDPSAARSLSWVEEREADGDIPEGAVVVVQADGTVTLADTVNDPRPTGVALDDIDDGDTGQVCFGGPVGLVLVTASVTGGDFGQTSTTPGEAQVTAGPGSAFCMFTSSGTTPTAFLWGGRGGGGVAAGLLIEMLSTGEMDTSLFLHPDGTGGVEWTSDGGGGGSSIYRNVQDYGAVGDGTTDDTAAIQAAIDDCIAYETLFFPATSSYYKITATLTIPVGLRLLGGGAESVGVDYAAVIRITTSNTTAISATVFEQDISIENLTIAGPGSAASGRGLYSSSNTRLRGVRIAGFYDAVYIDDSLGVPPSSAFYNHIERCWFVANAHAGVVLHTKTNNTSIVETYFAAQAYGVLADGGAYGIRIIDSSFEIHTSVAISIDGNGASQDTKAVYIAGCYFEQITGSPTADVLIGPNNTVYGVLIEGCFFIESPVTTLYHIDVNKADAVTIIGNYIGNNAEAGAIRGSSTNTTNMALINNRVPGTVTTPATTRVVDATDVTPAAISTANAVGSSKYLARADHVHQNNAPGASFATPAIVLGTAAAAGAASTVIRSDSTIVAFDATVPVTQAFSDTAATGSAAVAARRDHRHGMPAASGGIGEILISDTPSTPLVFADLLQNEAQDDLLYADP